jgi:hypothetical protein
VSTGSPFLDQLLAAGVVFCLGLWACGIGWAAEEAIRIIREARDADD